MRRVIHKLEDIIKLKGTIHYWLFQNLDILFPLIIIMHQRHILMIMYIMEHLFAEIKLQTALLFLRCVMLCKIALRHHKVYVEPMDCANVFGHSKALIALINQFLLLLHNFLTKLKPQ